MIIKNAGFYHFMQGFGCISYGHHEDALACFKISSLFFEYDDAKFVMAVIGDTCPTLDEFTRLFNDKEDVLSLFITGYLFDNVNVLKESAALGCSHACVSLYKLTLKEKYFKKSCELNHPDALFTLGKINPLYNNEIIEKAALNGSVHALRHLMEGVTEKNVKWTCLCIKTFKMTEVVPLDYYVGKILSHVLQKKTDVHFIYLIGSVSRDITTQSCVMSHKYYKKWYDLARDSTLYAMCIFKHWIKLPNDLIKLIGELIWSTRSEPWFPEIFFENRKGFKYF